MGIRKAIIDDWKEISELLEQLDYPNTESFIKVKIEKLLNHPDEELLVYEYEERVIAFISLHFIPQIALEGDFARISYFAVDKAIRSKGIGREIENHCVNFAKERRCDRIEVHCHSRRLDAHRFYFRQGYNESPKYLMKKIVY
ncbi:MAG TPA: GNAT family N-acetyltransferase [Clostridiales bacterium]|nr:GNAT family N-acetyltransferase [Clostridiales bacterium]